MGGELLFRIAVIVVGMLPVALLAFAVFMM
ncbi:hypothetical protein ABIB07_003963 [Bradyrhizobium sp. RT10b]